MIWAFAGFVIALVIFVAIFLNVLETSRRRAEIETLRKQYATATRLHQPREHLRRELVLAMCRELRGL